MGSVNNQLDELAREEDPGEGDLPVQGPTAQLEVPLPDVTDLPQDETVMGVFRRHSDVVPKRMVIGDQEDTDEDEGLDDPQVLAHELGNKVTVIGNALSLLKRQITPEMLQDETVRHVLSVLEEEQEGMAHMLLRVRKRISDSPSAALAPEETPEYAVINVSELMEAEVKLWRRILRMNIAITRDFPQGIKIRGDHVELHQIVHNIFRNAIQIMQDLPEEERRIHVRIRRKEGYVYIFIHDNGPGIKEEDKGKIGTKHFTRKKGKGIGLYYSQKLARKIGGEISLKNTRDLTQEDLDDDAFDEISPVSQRSRPKHEHRHRVTRTLLNKIERVLVLFELLTRSKQVYEPRSPRKICVEDFKGATAIIKLRAVHEETAIEEPYRPVR